MKNITLTLALTSLLVMNSYGDLAISGPGMKSALYLTDREVSDYKGYLAKDGVSEPFDYIEISEIEWQLSAGASTESQFSMNPNGKYHPRSQAGTSRCTITLTDMYAVNGGTRKTYSTNDFQLTNVKDVNDVKTGSIKFDPPLVFENAIVGFTVNQNMVNMTGDNSNGDSISYIWFHGKAYEQSPIPTGDINVETLVNTNDLPKIEWEITRIADLISNPPIIGGPESSTSSEPVTTTEQSSGGNSNNGHGNNVDGVDVSNPGKSAEKWAARGIIDESGAFDDEASKD